MDIQEFGDNDGPYDFTCDITDNEWVELYMNEGFDKDDIEDVVLNSLVGIDWHKAAGLIAFADDTDKAAELGRMLIRAAGNNLRNYMKSEAMEAEGCYEPY